MNYLFMWLVGYSEFESTGNLSNHMDEFGEPTPDLSGSLISMSFGQGGRINSMWVTDPALPEEGEEFQFILPALPFGEENAEDLYPGTIMIGARISQNDPWIFSRNSQAQHVLNFDTEDEMDPSVVSFDYEFPLLPEIQGRGRYFEVGGPVPHIVWEVVLRNNGRVSIEVGEVGFPLALNTFYDGFGWSDDQLTKLWNSRLYVHKFIGGAASWLFAQRMTNEPPGLLICPGDDHGWEFFCSIPGSLTTTHQWEGIPVVYAFSRATVEREGWAKWWNEHTSFVLEPGDTRVFQLRFVPTERDKHDGVATVLAALDRPAIRVLPSCVVPIDVGIGVEVQGVQPNRFFVSREATVQTDTDESGGFCFVKAREPGRIRLTIEDKRGRLSHVHLMFTAPIESMIQKRAQYIVENQIVDDPASPLHHAIVCVDTITNEKVTDPEAFLGSTGIECSLADALFLAEKNRQMPDRGQIQILDRYIEEFLLDDIQNPSDMSVGSVLLEDSGIAGYVGRPPSYPPVFCLHHSMYEIASTYGETKHSPQEYLSRAAQTIEAMFRFGWRNYVMTVGSLGYSRIYKILISLEKEGMHEVATRIRKLVEEKARAITKLEHPYAGESILDTQGFEEVLAAALYLNDDKHIERVMRCATATKSLAASWWWHGSDKRSWDSADSSPLFAMKDRGEACLAYTTIPNSLMFFSLMDRDYLDLPDVYMRAAFGGMTGPWALVRNDGAASMHYCPDASSKQFGYSTMTGASGLGYAQYLDGVSAYVLPNGSQGTYTFGCHFESEAGAYSIRPWDGVGRRVYLRQISAGFELSFGRFSLVRLDQRKRWFEVRIENPCDKDVKCELKVNGLWGTQIQTLGRMIESKDGVFGINLVLPANQTVHVTGKVMP